MTRPVFDPDEGIALLSPVPSPPPAIQVPVTSDTTARPSPVAPPIRAFLPWLGQHLQAYATIWREWRGNEPGDGPLPPVDPATRIPPLLRRPGEGHPRPGSGNAIGEAIIHSGGYLKHLLMPTLALDQEVVGYAASISIMANDDGDFPMDVVPLPEYAPILRFEGRYRPRFPRGGAISRTLNTPRSLALAQRYGTIHCEFKADHLTTVLPFLLDVQRLLRRGQTPVVAVRGRWTFDGFHAGWVELHPARSGRVVSETGEGYPDPLPIPDDGAEGGEDDDP